MMPGHRPFHDLTRGFSPACKARVGDKAAALETARFPEEAVTIADVGEKDDASSK